MIRPVFWIVVYLALAEAFEFAIQPVFVAHHLLPEGLGLRWLALAGVMAGMTYGRMGGLVVALVAASLFGVSHWPGHLGASIASFSAAAYLAGVAGWYFRLKGVGFRWFLITTLLMIECLVWGLVRWFFWSSTPLGIGWSTLFSIILTALLGAWILALGDARLAHRNRRHRRADG
jgi:hypothetical protein